MTTSREQVANVAKALFFAALAAFLLWRTAEHFANEQWTVASLLGVVAAVALVAGLVALYAARPARWR